MCHLGIDVWLSSMEIEWDHCTMPFKKHDVTVYDSYHIYEPALVDEHAERVKKILDAKYEAADLEQVCSAQMHLQAEQQWKLLSLLTKYVQKPF